MFRNTLFFLIFFDDVGSQEAGKPASVWGEKTGTGLGADETVTAVPSQCRQFTK